MKAAPFEYSRPADIDEACALLAADDGARVIAGGQTLVPMMAMRLARPTRLVDIARISALSFIRENGGDIVIGAATRQCEVERSALVSRRQPLLAKVMPWIGHAATRARGTVGGSLANGDPAAELGLVAVTLDATLGYRLAGKSENVAASEFFVGPMVTALPAGACLTEVKFPVWNGAPVGTGFHEVSARRSDFAFAAAACQLALDNDGTCTRIAIGLGAVTDVPIRLAGAEKQLTGGKLDAAKVQGAINDAMRDIEPMSDPHATAAYRRRVAAGLAARAIADAFENAKGRKAHAH